MELPETKGRTLAEVQAMLAADRPRGGIREGCRSRGANARRQADDASAGSR